VDGRAHRYHVAGHLVAAWALRLPIPAVTAVVEEGAPDSCLDRGLLDRGLPRWFRADMVMDGRYWVLAANRIVEDFAGPEAERRYRARAGKPDERKVRLAANGDDRSSDSLARYLTWSDAESAPLLAWLRTRAGGLVERRWTLVERLAEDLLISGNVNSREINKRLAGWAVEDTSLGPVGHPADPSHG
jgi:hypothetical protein